MQDTEAGTATRGDRPEEKSERAFSEGEPQADGVVADFVILFSLIGSSIRDAIQLLGLESRLVAKTGIMMLVIGVVYGLVIVGIWFSVTVIVAAGLYEYTGLGLTLSIAAASLVNVACAGALLIVLKRLSRRLAFPETRLAVRSLLDDAFRASRKKE